MYLTTLIKEKNYDTFYQKIMFHLDLFFTSNYFHYLYIRGAMVERLEHLAMVRKVAGSSPARAKVWKALIVHQAANGYLIKVWEG